MSFTFILFQYNKLIFKKKHGKLRLFGAANIVLLTNIPQFIIQIYYITTTFTVHTNGCSSKIKMASSKNTASVWGSITTKYKQEIGNNIMKKINTKNNKDKKPTAYATSRSGTHGTNCASLVSVSSNSNHSGHHNNYHSDSR